VNIKIAIIARQKNAANTNYYFKKTR